MPSSAIVRGPSRQCMYLQYFFAASEGRYYAMQAVFFRAELVEESHGAAEYELCWLDVNHPGPWFFHACHDWAVRQS